MRQSCLRTLCVHVQLWRTYIVYVMCMSEQAAVLACPAGMTRLVDVLEDPREEIRNELLLILLKLTQHNQEMQISVAFQVSFVIA